MFHNQASAGVVGHFVQMPRHETLYHHQFGLIALI
jgi:hypothetical protein